MDKQSLRKQTRFFRKNTRKRSEALEDKYDEWLRKEVSSGKSDKRREKRERLTTEETEREREGKKGKEDPTPSELKEDY